MNELLEKIGNYVIENQKVDISDIQKSLDINRGTVVQGIKHLHNIGLLDKENNVVLDNNSFTEKLQEYNKNFPDVTISRNLVVEETDKAIKTRVPGTYDDNVRYMWLSKDNITDINDGKTILSFIDLSRKYKLYGNDGKVAETVTGRNLYNHYDTVNEKVRNRLNTPANGADNVTSIPQKEKPVTVSEVKNNIEKMSEVSQESAVVEKAPEKKSQSETISPTHSVSDREINRIISDVDRYKDELLISDQSVSEIDTKYQEITEQLNTLQAEVEMLRHKGIKNSLSGTVRYIKDGVMSSREKFLTAGDKAIEKIKSGVGKNPSVGHRYASDVNSAKQEIKSVSKVANAAANNMQNISANIPVQNNDAARLVVIEELLKAILKKLLGLENTLSAAVENINQRTNNLEQQNQNRQTALIQIHGLYRHYNGSDLIHYSIEQNGKKTDCLTNGAMTWTNDDGRQGERLNQLTRVDSVDIKRLEENINRSKPVYFSAEAINIVKTTQQQNVQSQAVPMKK